jgi:diaminohydroxyphosphoribosylaminopyrimidine deaminase/5-amino-6-(5-phosphoribosylamino)uracil reductase
MMRLALAAARLGDGRTHPNPSVGAVVFRGDRVLGRGTTRPPGGAHAEIVAMQNARRRHGPRALRGAEMAVTLEPCSFTGRTGPCADALVEAGLARVVVGCRDPHPNVRGRGLRRLRRAGIAVETDVLLDRCREQHRGFLSVHERGRPWLTLKLATSLDGRIATAGGASRWITGPEARAEVHRLRDRHDAVMVGSETALADDPSLTVRREDRILRTPIRVLVDGRLRVPTTHRLLSDADADRTWVLCSEKARGRTGRRAAPPRLLELPAGEGGHVDLAQALEVLAAEGLTSLFVEGGGGLAAALLRARLVDEVHWMLAPKLIGGDGRAALGPLAIEGMDEVIRLASPRMVRCGEDLHLSGRVAPLSPGPRRGGRGRKA